MDMLGIDSPWHRRGIWDGWEQASSGSCFFSVVCEGRLKTTALKNPAQKAKLDGMNHISPVHAKLTLQALATLSSLSIDKKGKYDSLNWNKKKLKQRD